MKPSQVPIIEFAGYEVHDLRLPETGFPVDSALYVVRRGDQWDLLAWKAYGDESLWWIIADANGVDDPLQELVPGTTLVIPSL